MHSSGYEPECLHPTVLINDELESRGWTLETLAQRIAASTGDDLAQTGMVLLAYWDIGPTTENMRMGGWLANALSDAFGISAEYFLNLEKAWLTCRAAPTPAVRGML